ncbi:Ribonuclease J1 [Candidatus Magnetomoraceae bacterium gMMP-1]
MNKKSLKIIPLGGLGEIGLNMMVFEYDDTLLIVDAGIMFPESYMLGIDIVIPDITYLKQNSSRIAAIILTHGHEDHIGAIPFVLKEINVPIYGTPFTLGLLQHKLEEHDLLKSTSLHEVNPRDKIKIKMFEIEFIRVSHSIIDCVGLAINTPEGLIVHTGDFKLAPTLIKGGNTDLNAFARCGDQGILALLSDSTNVEKEGYTICEREIGNTLQNIISQSSGRLIVAVFASNISRIQQIVDIAKSRGSKILFNGKSIEVSTRIAESLGYMNVPEKMRINVGQVKNFPDDQVIMITTGSQGEPMSSLARMASGNHKHIKIKKGDTVILSSKFIPGNEKAIANIINKLYRRGADVIYEKISAIHVSGHAFQEELKMMINLTKPKYFIPIHGEYRHLTHHARLAEQTGIPRKRVLLVENGHIIEFKNGEGHISEKIETGRILIDGKGIGDVGKCVLRERRVLSEDGFVVVTMIMDEETGIVIYGPEIDSRGFIFHTEKGHLLDDAICVILEIMDDVSPNTPDRLEKIRSDVKKNLRQYFKFVIKRRPVIIPLILEV